jgi:hypothetical protein
MQQRGFCSFKYFFKNKQIHMYTWEQHTRKLKSALGLVLMK